MKTNIKEITVKVEGKEWKEAIEKALETASKKVKIDGFRPGKAPKDIVLKKFGEESLYFDAADIVLEKAYKDVIDANAELQIVARPEIEVTSIGKDGVEFKFILTLKPVVKLKKYKGLKVKRDDVKVSKKEIDKAIEEMQKKYAETREKDGKVALGDTVNIDFEGFKDGVAFAGGKGDGFDLVIGSNQFIPGFEEQLIGMKKGENKKIEVTFPEEYHSEDLKGAKATFEVKVNEIKETVIPKLNKDFYEDLQIEGVDSLETLEKEVKKMIKEQKEIEIENKFIDDVMEAAIKETEVEIPEVMITEETDRIIKQYEENLKMQGLDLEQFFKFTNSTEEDLREQMKEEAIKRITSRLLLEEIAVLEGIEVALEEANEEAGKLAEKYNMEKEEFLKIFGGLEMVMYDSKMRKAMNVLKDNN